MAPSDAGSHWREIDSPPVLGNHILCSPQLDSQWLEATRQTLGNTWLSIAVPDLEGPRVHLNTKGEHLYLTLENPS